MINIAICDDDTNFCFKFMDYLLNHFKQDIHMIQEYSNGSELLADIQYNQLHFDIIFLDLDMPQLDGIKTGYALRKLPSHQNSMIMFITSYDSNPVPIVDIHPHAYFFKPLNYDEFHIKFAKALKNYIHDDTYLIIQNRSTIFRVNTRDILYVASQKRHCIFVTSEGSIPISLRLSDVVSLIQQQTNVFSQIHKSFYVNMNHISCVTHDHITLKSMETLPLSRTFKQSFLTDFHSFLT